jgi:hypothetical protein
LVLHPLEPDGVVVGVQEHPPEVHAEDGENRPLDRIQVTQTVAILGAGDLPPGGHNAEGHEEQEPEMQENGSSR